MTSISEKIPVTVFRGAKAQETYLFLPRPADLNALPDELVQRLGPLVEVMELDVSPSSKLARARAGEVIDALKKQGFFLQLPPTRDALMANDQLLR